MSETLGRVKESLGPEAVILHTRTVTKGGVLGVGARRVVEITATRDASVLPAAERRAMIGATSGRLGGVRGTRGDTGGRSARSPHAEGAAMSRSPGTTPEPASRADMATFTSTLRGEMDQLRAMVRELLARPGAGDSDSPVPDLPEELREYYRNLIQNEVAEEIARELIVQARDRLGGGPPAEAERDSGEQPRLRDVIHEVLVENIERMLPPAEPVQLRADGGPTWVAFVGPTGVGKTTTVAKLAAHFKLRQGKRVGLITIDSYRIAAVEQLRVYAEILNVPLEVVLTPDELPAALESMRHCDLVLIDTSGRSQRDARRLNELRAFFDAIRSSGADSGDEGGAGNKESHGSTRGGRADRLVLRGPDGRFRSKRSADHPGGSLEVHLVLSCAAHPGQLAEAAAKFSTLGVDRVVFTKLDEAVGLGVILSVIRRLKLQLSYLTTGQDVPDDIEIGHRRRIAELVLGRCEGETPFAGKNLGSTPVVDHVA